MAKKILAHPNVEWQDNIAYVEEGGRTRAIYFKETA
jgi:hypothetical protein